MHIFQIGNTIKNKNKGLLVYISVKKFLESCLGSSVLSVVVVFVFSFKQGSTEKSLCIFIAREPTMTQHPTKENAMFLFLQKINKNALWIK